MSFIMKMSSWCWPFLTHHWILQPVLVGLHSIGLFNLQRVFSKNIWLKWKVLERKNCFSNRSTFVLVFCIWELSFPGSDFDPQFLFMYNVPYSICKPCHGMTLHNNDCQWTRSASAPGFTVTEGYIFSYVLISKIRVCKSKFWCLSWKPVLT